MNKRTKHLAFSRRISSLYAHVAWNANRGFATNIWRRVLSRAIVVGVKPNIADPPRFPFSIYQTKKHMLITVAM